MKRDKDNDDDSYYSLKKLQKNAATMETKRNKESFDQLISSSNANKRYMKSTTSAEKRTV